MAERPLRAGRSLGRTLYVQTGDEPTKADRFIGVLDTWEWTAYVLACVNAAEAAGLAGPRPALPPAGTPRPTQAGARDPRDFADQLEEPRYDYVERGCQHELAAPGARPGPLARLRRRPR